MKRRIRADGWNVKEDEDDDDDDDDDIDDEDNDNEDDGNAKELSEAVSDTKLVRTWLHSLH